MEEHARLPRIGIVSSGQMGAAIGGVLIRHGGLEVLTALDGRGQATRDRAAEAGLRDAGDIGTLARETDVLLAIVLPSAAEGVATSIAAAIKGSEHPLVFVDCNAILPAMATRLDAMIARAGGRFVDAAIQSPPPNGPGLVLYASGPHALRLAFLRDHGLDVRVLPGPVGQASALDLVIGGASKLFEAAAAQVFLAARHWGLEDMLYERVPRVVNAVEHLAPMMPSRVRRWSEEMTETGHFMRDMGLPSGLFAGAAELFALMAKSEKVRCGTIPVEAISQKDVIRLIAEDLEKAGLLRSVNAASEAVKKP